LKNLCDEAKLQSLRSCKFEFAPGLTEACFERALEVVLNDPVVAQKKEGVIKGKKR
jgi:hypothetical protein